MVCGLIDSEPPPPGEGLGEGVGDGDGDGDGDVGVDDPPPHCARASVSKPIAASQSSRCVRMPDRTAELSPLCSGRRPHAAPCTLNVIQNAKFKMQTTLL